MFYQWNFFLHNFLTSRYGLFPVLLKYVPLTFLIRLILCWRTPLSFIYLGNSFSLQFWMIMLPGRVLLSVFHFSNLNISCHHKILSCKVSTEKPAYGVSLYVTSFFSLDAFNTLFIFNFWHFNYYLVWAFLFSLDLDVCYFYLGQFSAIISSNKFSTPFPLFFPSETPILQMLGCFMLLQRFLNLFLFLFVLFPFCCSFECFPFPSSRALISSSASSNLILIPSSIFSILFTVFFIFHRIFFLCSISTEVLTDFTHSFP